MSAASHPLLYVGPGIGLGSIVIVLLLLALILFALGALLWMPLSRGVRDLKQGRSPVRRGFLRVIARWLAWCTLAVLVVSLIAWGAVEGTKGHRPLGGLSGILARMAAWPKEVGAVLESDALRGIPDFYGPAPAGFKAVNELDRSILGIGAFWDRGSDSWKVRLFDLRTDSLRWEWNVARDQPGASWQLAEVGRLFENSPPLHPYLFADGSFAAKLDMTPNLFRMDRQGRILWVNHDLVFHHAMHADADGALWTCASDLPLGRGGPLIGRTVYTPSTGRLAYQEDHIVKVDPADGRIVFKRGVAGILIDNGLQGRVFGGDMVEPIHLNDVVPLLHDGPHWQRGDLLLSVRNRSLVLLYRPATDSILRVIDGPFFAQHDVNVLSPDRISLFSNRQIFEEQYAPSNLAWVPRDRGLPIDSINYSQVFEYDLDDGRFNTVEDDALRRMNARTGTQGLHELLPDGSLYLELPGMREYMVIRDGRVVLNKVFGAPMRGRVHKCTWVRVLPDSAVRAAGFNKAIGLVPDVNGLSGEFAPGAPPMASATVAPRVSAPLLWAVVLLASVLLALGVMLLARPFRHLVERTGKLLDAVLDRRTEEGTRMRTLSGAVWNETTALLAFVLLALVVLLVSAIPLMVLGGATSPWVFISAPFHGWNMLAVLIGTTLPFIIASRLGRRSDYSPWSRTLHRVVLDNTHLSRALFALERGRLRRRATPAAAQGPVIVSGLARAGTTALTTMLARSPILHSLSYANMPFLLAPNLWQKFYKPRDTRARERSHGDKVQFSLTSVEALEDHFFKVFMGERYILPDRLVEHAVDAEVLDAYTDYQRVVIPADRPEGAYLAKNNNMILRYASLHGHMPGLRAIFLFRDPLEHASSLMNQHERFSAMQRIDPFVKEYMDWLVHHEFGLGARHFEFADGTGLPKAPPSSIDHWIEKWIAYYKRLLVLLEEHPALLIDHADLLRDPNGVIKRIENHLGMNLGLPEAELFEHRRAYSGPINEALVAEAMELYHALRQRQEQAPH